MACLESSLSPPGMHPAGALAMRQGRGRTSHHGPAHGSACAPFPCAAGALSPFVGRTTGSQCSRFLLWASDHQAVWHPRTLCGFARVGKGLTGVPGRDHRLSLLGQPCFSEWNLVTSCSGFCSISLLFCLCSPSIPLFLPFLVSGGSYFVRLSLTTLGISSSTSSLRNSWDIHLVDFIMVSHPYSIYIWPTNCATRW